jgi:hypothetical protein
VNGLNSLKIYVYEYIHKNIYIYILFIKKNIYIYILFIKNIYIHTYIQTYIYKYIYIHKGLKVKK